MENKSILIDEETFQKLLKLESSMKHWSLRHTELSLQVQQALNQFHSMNQAKQSIVLGLVKENNIDPNAVMEAHITNENGSPCLSVQFESNEEKSG